MIGVASAKKGPELMAHCADMIEHTLVRLACLDDDQAEVIAGTIMDHMAKRWGGRAINVLSRPEDRAAQRQRAKERGRCETQRDPSMLFADCESLLRILLVRDAGATAKKAAKVAGAVIDVIGDAWAGQNLYLPRHWRGFNVERDESIFRRFNNSNAMQLAEEHGLSYVRIYQIVKRMREQRRARNAQATANAQGRYQVTTLTS